MLRFRCTWPFAPRTSVFSRSEKPHVFADCLAAKCLTAFPHAVHGVRTGLILVRLSHFSQAFAVIWHPSDVAILKQGHASPLPAVVPERPLRSLLLCVAVCTCFWPWWFVLANGTTQRNEERRGLLGATGRSSKSTMYFPARRRLGRLPAVAHCYSEHLESLGPLSL